MDIIRRFVVLLFCFFLSACANTSRAPVREAWHQPLRVPVLYTIQKGDSLYAIAFLYGIDYRQIARVNHIQSPYAIHPGQQLILTPASNQMPVNYSAPKQQPVIIKKNKTIVQQPKIISSNKFTTTTMTPVNTRVKTAGIVWMWPARGNVDDNFSENGFNKGIDILGTSGEPVVAAASGRVVYAGTGLRSYGALIIIKHNDDFLSAYAHNQKLFVHEGQSVKIGQTIATMGNTDAKRVMLHFEIRQVGKPVDPLKYLPMR